MAQEEALKIQREQLELKEKQETAVRAAQERQAAKEAEEARAKQEALVQQAAAAAEKVATSEPTVVAHQKTETVLGPRSAQSSISFCWLFFNNTQSRFVSVFHGYVHGPPRLAARHT